MRRNLNHAGPEAGAPGALRGLKAKTTIPQITPLLSHADKNVMRDACHTLAVQKDAADAIAILKEK